ncbi:MAG: hypothetical protein ACRDY7_10040 [Acidimicrobiia bacterium]
MGPAGPAGAKGPAGPRGADGVSGYEVVTSRVVLRGDEPASATVACPPGKVALGGGALPEAATTLQALAMAKRLMVLQSAPVLQPAAGTGWVATVRHDTESPGEELAVLFSAVCALAG